jgi:enterochelin esterase-like enzyme
MTLRALSCLFVLSTLAGCAGVPSPSAVAAATEAPVSTPTVAPLPSATSTPAGCTETEGQVTSHEIALPDDPRPLAYQLYFPPCFDPRSAVRYPSLYLLHGLAQSEAAWIQLGVAAAADELILDGEAPPFVIVLPGERTGYDMLPTITETLLPDLESSLPIGGTLELRAIGGISRGAGWALRIGAQRPDLFGAIGMHSPAVLSPDLYVLPDWVRAVKGAALPRLWLDIGYDDTLLPKALDLRQALDQVRWPYTWTIERGEHSSSYWSPRLRTYLRWYAEGWPVPPPAGAGLGT